MARRAGTVEPLWAAPVMHPPADHADAVRSRQTRLRCATMAGAVMAMDPRQYCATCRHIRHVTEESGNTYYLCSRLGWPTKPGWRFDCWDPRPLRTPPARIRPNAPPPNRRP